MNSIEMVKLLLNYESINVNLYNINNGDTPLITALKRNYIDIAKTLINYPKTNINKKNYDNESPLMIAVSQQNENIVDLLINDEKFDANESLLNCCFFISSGKISQKLISVKSLDVNYKMDRDEIQKLNQKGITKNRINTNLSNLMKAVIDTDNEKIDLIIHHPTFDKIKSNLADVISVLIRNRFNMEIFNKLVNLDDINMIRLQGNSLLYNAVIYNNKDILNLIINNPSFDSKKSGIAKAFELTNSKYIAKLLYNFDKNHDHLIDLNKLREDGYTYLTRIRNDCEIFEFYLNNNADPNIPDKFGEYPLQKNIECSNFQLIETLIKSNKIDYNKKIKIGLVDDNDAQYTTYLHLAASKNSLILSLLLNIDSIDVNITNDLGETPLMIAVKCEKIRNIDLLFNREDLDYLHKDNLGRDAIKIAAPVRDFFIDDERTFDKQRDKPKSQMKLEEKKS